MDVVTNGSAFFCATINLAAFSPARPTRAKARGSPVEAAVREKPRPASVQVC